MLTDFQGHRLRHANSVLAPIAQRWTRQWNCRTNHLTLNPWVIRKMQIWYTVQSSEDWVAQLDDDLSRPASQAGELFRITALQLEDNTCVTVLEWIRSDTFPPWTEVKSLCPELRFLWHHRNNLSADTNGVIWRKRIVE